MPLRIRDFVFNEKEMIPSNIALIAPTNSGKSVMIKYILYKLRAFRFGYVYIGSGGKATTFYTDFMPKEHVKVVKDSDEVPAHEPDIEKQLVRSALYCNTLEFLKEFVCKRELDYAVIESLMNYGTSKFLNPVEALRLKEMIAIGERLELNAIEQIDLRILYVDIRMFMVFDDILGLDFLRRKGSAFSALFTMGRQNFITTIVAVQYIVGLPPIVRVNTKYVFVLGNISNSEGFYRHFAMAHFKAKFHRGGPALKAFIQMYTSCTENYRALVFNQHSNTNNIEGCFFHTKAPRVINNFKACDRVFWLKQHRRQHARQTKIRNSIQLRLHNDPTIRRRRRSKKQRKRIRRIN